MRYLIYGAGAIGGTIGARLFQTGKDVMLIARGEHLEKIQSIGLVLADPRESVTLKIPAVGHPSEIEFRNDDVVFLTMKSQQTLVALEDLRAAAGESIPLICCQNGVANERMAVRRFNRVYGMVVILPASHIEPGVVIHDAMTCGGILDAGCFPSGTDALITTVTQDLELAGFSAVADEQVMRWKYAKLLNNLVNALQAVTRMSEESRAIIRKMKHEALRCFEAAGISCASVEEVQRRHDNLLKIGKVAGQKQSDSSTWQSVLRRTGNIETDYLNGEIVQLGKLHNIPTPVNRCLLELGNKIVRTGAKPGSMSEGEVLARLRELESI
jgi:2-dehydropantoate 2-reductase